jgi:arsenate reductase
MNATVPTNSGNVLFLCTGNSCRSQIAEAIVNSQLSARWQAFSAGIKPTGYVHPKAIDVLSEIDIHHIGTSKSISELIDHEFDLVVTVCDSAAEECPTWLKPGKLVHLSFPDPAKVIGDEVHVLAKFREVRDAIAMQIPELLNNIDLKGVQGELKAT